VRKTGSLFLLVFLLLTFPVFTAKLFASDQISVVSIEFEGNVRVDRRSIERVLGWKVGDAWDPGKLTSSVKNIYDMGTFSRVTIDETETDMGMALVVRVKEFPMVRSITFSGIDKIDESDLKQAIKFKNFGFYDPAKLPADKKAILDLYSVEGFYEAQVEAQVKETEQGIGILFEIEEGKKTNIREMDVLGNRSLNDKEVLKVMQTKEMGPFSWILGGSSYKPLLLEDDLKRVHLLYMEHGYLDIKATGPEVRIHPEGGLYVSIRVEEGVQYKVGEIKFSGDWTALPEDRRSDLDLNAGDIFARGKMLRDINMLENSIKDKGYAWARVAPRMNKNPETGVVDIDLILTRGELVRVRRVVVSGNYKTRDYVIRREVRLLEGDLYNQKLVDNTRRFVRALGFFDSVTVNVENVGMGEADIIVSVEEGSTGTITAGIALSSQDGLLGSLSLAKANIFGRGQELKFSIELGTQITTFNISFAEPRLFSSKYSFGANIFRARRDFTTYTQDSKGGNTRIGYRYSDFSSILLRYQYVVYNVFDISPGAGLLILEQEGESITSSATISYRYDSRDLPTDARDGLFTTLSSEIAGGILGGSNDFWRNIFEASYFVPIIGDLIGSVHSEVGIISPYNGDDIPITERFFMGGLYSLRGFDYRDVGPKNLQGEPIGGDRSFLVNMEAVYPIVKEANIRGVVFFDIGNVWGPWEDPEFSDLRTAAGFGFRWFSPMGVLRLELGFNLDPKEGEVQPGWQFSMGALF
jgi:outer membrane protein insertion porin family